MVAALTDVLVVALVGGLDRALVAPLAPLVAPLVAPLAPLVGALDVPLAGRHEQWRGACQQV